MVCVLSIGKSPIIPYPFIGPILQIEKASALCSSSEISLTVPGAFEIIAAAQNAPINLNTRIVAIFCASAQGRTKITNSPSAMMYTGRRPYISDKGARTTLPQAIPSKYVVTPKMPVFREIPRSLIRPGMADVYEVE
jgi:hypothetical protein